MISRDGVIIRIAAESIRICSRPSKGVTVMKFAGDDKVVTLATVPHEDENSENSDEIVELSEASTGAEEAPAEE